MSDLALPGGLVIPPRRIELPAPGLLMPGAQQLLRRPLERWKRHRAADDIMVLAAPTPIQHAEVSSWTTTTSPKTASITGNAGDRITVLGATADTATLSTPTNDGAALTWTATTAFGTPGSSTQARGWSTTLDTSRTVVISVARSATVNQYGFFADVWRDSDGIGNSGGVNVDTTVSYSCSVTTTQDNSALVGIASDWSAINGARTWTAISNAFVSEEAIFSSTQYYVAGGYYPDVGTAGAKTPAISAPSGETVTMVFIEVKGTAGAAATSDPFPSAAARAFRAMLLR